MNKKKKKLSSNFSLISLDITDVGYKGEGIAKLITELNFEEKDYNFFVRDGFVDLWVVVHIIEATECPCSFPRFLIFIQ